MIRKWVSEITATSVSVFGAASAVGGILIYLFGPWNKLFMGLFVLFGADVITGVMTALKKKSDKTEDGKLSSKAGTEGLFKKIGVVVCIAVIYTLGYMFLPNEDQALLVRNMAICGFGFFEAVSVIENLNTLGVKIPPIVIKFIKVIKKKVYADEPINLNLTEEPVSDEENNYEEREEAAEPSES